MSTRERVIRNDLPEEIAYRFVRDLDNPPPYSSLEPGQSTNFEPGHYYLELKVDEGTQLSTAFHHFITVQSVAAEPRHEGDDLYIYHLIVPSLKDKGIPNDNDEDVILFHPDDEEEK